MHRYNGRCPVCKASIVISTEELVDLLTELQQIDQDPQSFHLEHCEREGCANYEEVDISIGGKTK